MEAQARSKRNPLRRPRRALTIVASLLGVLVVGLGVTLVLLLGQVNDLSDDVDKQKADIASLTKRTNAADDRLALDGAGDTNFALSIVDLQSQVDDLLSMVLDATSASSGPPTPEQQERAREILSGRTSAPRNPPTNP